MNNGRIVSPQGFRSLCANDDDIQWFDARAEGGHSNFRSNPSIGTQSTIYPRFSIMTSADVERLRAMEESPYTEEAWGTSRQG